MKKAKKKYVITFGNNNMTLSENTQTNAIQTVREILSDGVTKVSIEVKPRD